jgi:hypothetical protein
VSASRAWQSAKKRPGGGRLPAAAAIRKNGDGLALRFGPPMIYQDR